MHRRDTSSAARGRGLAATEPDHRRRVWRVGEDLAAVHFQRLGFTVLARNMRTRYGEIDLIAFDGRTLVFAEVKTRRLRRGDGEPAVCHDPLSSLRPRQRVRLRRLAAAWLCSDRFRTGSGGRLSAETIRFDALGVVVDATDQLLRLDHLEGAW